MQSFEWDADMHSAAVTDDGGDRIEFTRAGAAIVVSIGSDHAVSVPDDVFDVIASRLRRGRAR